MSRARCAALSAATLATLLAACERPSTEPQPAPAPSSVATKPSRNASIIRPDVEAAAAPEPALAPLELRLGFGDGGTKLSDPVIAELKEALASEQMELGGPIRIAGHSDSAGSDTANLAASRRRADAVRDWLVEHGVAEDRITVVAFGEQNPIAPNALPDGKPDTAGRAKNRRVELTIAPSQAAPTPTPSEDPTLVDQLAGET